MIMNMYDIDIFRLLLEQHHRMEWNAGKVMERYLNIVKS